MNTRAALIHAGHVDHCEMPLLRQGSPKKMQEERKSWRRTLVDRFFFWWGTGPVLHSCLWQTSAPTPQCPFGAVSPCILPCRCFSQSIFVSSSCHIALVAQMLLDLSISGVQPSSCWKCGAWRLMRRLSVFLFADGELRVPPLVPLFLPSKEMGVKVDGSFSPEIRHFLGFTGGSAVTQGDGFVPSRLLPGEMWFLSLILCLCWSQCPCTRAFNVDPRVGHNRT